MDNVPEDKAFILDNKKIKNTKQLLKEIQNISDEKYGHFASEKHNYFADWLEYVVGDKELASKLRAATSRYVAIDILKSRPEEKKAEEEPKKEETKPLESAQNDNPNMRQKVVIADKSQEKPQTVKEDIQPADSSSKLDTIMKDEREIKDFLWKHFAWDMAKEFMYGMAIGILIGFVLARIFIINS